jgi:hypothetical protein
VTTSAEDRLRAGLVALVTLASASVAQAQAHGVTTATLDAIGPRSGVSIQSTLLAHATELDSCRGEAEALVSVTFAIAPDGSVIAPASGEDPELDRAATDCTLGVLARLHFRAHATSTTTVAWTFRLAAPTLRHCFCFSWIHGPDHGHTCEPTRAACEREHASFSRERTECRASDEATCAHEAWIGGQHYRR